MQTKKLILASLLCFSVAAAADDSSFTVKKIDIEGLQHLPKSVVMNNLSVKVGDQLSQQQTNDIIKSLFKTGYFADIKLLRQGDTLVLDLQERPTIGKITIDGNSLIKKKMLQPVLLKVGLQAGNIYDESKLHKMTQSLEQQYYMLGKYAVRVTTDIKKLPRNRVAIKIHISEGLYTKVERVNFVGNKKYSDGKLEDNFKLTTPSLITFFTNNDQYTRKKMGESLQELSDFYMNNGFLKFKIDSSQVSLTPTKKQALLTVNLTEGGKYKFGKVELNGQFVVPKKELQKLVQPRKGETFSRQEVMDTAKAIQRKLADKGYAFATVNPRPDVNDKTKTVGINFYINPGRRVYVHRIIFDGNDVTNDQTLRERMLFPEGSLYNQTKVDQSKRRLSRLPYIADAQVANVPVPNSTDEVDVHYKLTERSANKVGASIGYSELNKVILGGYLNMPNVFGTGNIFDINLSLSRPSQSINFTYTQPYFTQSGVSQSINVYLSKLDNKYRSLVSYSLNQYGGNLTYGIPMSVFDKVNVGAGVDHTQLMNPSGSTSKTVNNFTGIHGNGYNTLSMNLGWSRDTTNDAFFPSVGSQTSIGTNVATPISSLTWYKVFAHGGWFHSIYWDRFVFGISGDAKYGDGYGKMNELPFYENFYGGGWGSVRGYAQGGMGPHDLLCDTPAMTTCTQKGDPLGGNLALDASMNLYFPVPGLWNNRKVRLGLFADAGNVYDTRDLNTIYEKGANPTHPNFENLRYSVGVQLQWLTPIGAVGFSLAKPLNSKPGDDTRIFQFTLGQFF